MSQEVQKIQIGRFSLAYSFLGQNNDQPLIVFLHEGLGSIAQWKAFPEKLCKSTGLQGLIYERQGYGHSDALAQDRTESYLHDYALNELPDLINALNLNNREIILFGHSDGGSIALIYANRYPENVVGLITEAAHVFVEQVTLDGIEPAVKAFEAGKLKGLEKYHGAKSEQIFFAWANTWRTSKFRDWNIENEISNINCPSLIVQGLDDQYGTPFQVETICNKVERAVPLLIENCGHSPHIEQTEIVLEKSTAFIKNILDEN